MEAVMNMSKMVIPCFLILQLICPRFAVSEQQKKQESRYEEDIILIVKTLESGGLDERITIVERFKKDKNMKQLISDDRILGALTKLYGNLPVIQTLDDRTYVFEHKKEINLKVDVFTLLCSSNSRHAHGFFQKVLTGDDTVMKALAEGLQKKLKLFDESNEDTSQNLLVGIDLSAGSIETLRTFLTYVLQIPVPEIRMKILSEVRRQTNYLLQEGILERRRTVIETLINQYRREQEKYIKEEIIGIVSLLGEEDRNTISFLQDVAKNAADKDLREEAQQALLVTNSSSGTKPRK
jgi:hypothetical protein